MIFLRINCQILCSLNSKCKSGPKISAIRTIFIGVDPVRAWWSGGAFKLPQWVQAEPGHQTVFGEF